VTVGYRPPPASSTTATLNPDGTALVKWSPPTSQPQLGYAVILTPNTGAVVKGSVLPSYTPPPVALAQQKYTWYTKFIANVFSISSRFFSPATIPTAPPTSITLSGLTSSQNYSPAINTVNDNGWSTTAAGNTIVSRVAPQIPMLGTADGSGRSSFAGSPQQPGLQKLPGTVSIKSGIVVSGQGYLYGTSDGFVNGVDTSGNLLPGWSSGNQGFTGTPVISSTGTVFCATTNGIAKLNSTGGIAQSYTSMTVRSSPVIDSDVIYLISSGNAVYSFPVANLSSPTIVTFETIVTDTIPKQLAYKNGVLAIVGYNSSGKMCIGIRTGSTNYYVSNETTDSYGVFSQPIVQSDGCVLA